MEDFWCSLEPWSRSRNPWSWLKSGHTDALWLDIIRLLHTIWVVFVRLGAWSFNDFDTINASKLCLTKSPLIPYSLWEWADCRLIEAYESITAYQRGTWRDIFQQGVGLRDRLRSAYLMTTFADTCPTLGTPWGRHRCADAWRIGSSHPTETAQICSEAQCGRCIHLVTHLVCVPGSHTRTP